MVTSDIWIVLTAWRVSFSVCQSFCLSFFSLSHCQTLRFAVRSFPSHLPWNGRRKGFGSVYVLLTISLHLWGEAESSSFSSNCPCSTGRTSCRQEWRRNCERRCNEPSLGNEGQNVKKKRKKWIQIMEVKEKEKDNISKKSARKNGFTDIHGNNSFL